MSVIAQLQDILSHRPVKRKRAGWFCASRPAVRRTVAERAVLLAVDFTLPCGSTPFLWSYPKKGAFGRVRPRRLGGQKSRPVKVFCPAFLQKSGRGPGAAPLAARRSARKPLVPKKRRRGSPLCVRPAARNNPMKTPPIRAAFSPFPALWSAPRKTAARGPFPTRRRGRRPRRPFPSSTADPTAFCQPPVGAGFHPRPAGGDCGRYGVATAL